MGSHKTWAMHERAGHLILQTQSTKVTRIATTPMTTPRMIAVQCLMSQMALEGSALTGCRSPPQQGDPAMQQGLPSKQQHSSTVLLDTCSCTGYPFARMQQHCTCARAAVPRQSYLIRLLVLAAQKGMMYMDADISASTIDGLRVVSATQILSDSANKLDFLKFYAVAPFT